MLTVALEMLIWITPHLQWFQCICGSGSLKKPWHTVLYIFVFGTFVSIDQEPLTNKVVFLVYTTGGSFDL